MKAWICETCGVQYERTENPPDACIICEDERQYVAPGGQKWTTAEELLERGHQNRISLEEERLYSIGAEPELAIGQRALLLQTPEGNVLWDCVSLLDEETAERIEVLGGIRYIAMSHPHFYGAMASWAERFGVEILIHAADQKWVVGPRDRVRFWEGDHYRLMEEVTLVHTGGHFSGSTVLHWSKESGVLLTGDSIHVVSDRNWVSFMYSYPNAIPLPADKVTDIVRRLQGYEFHRLYGGWPGRVVQANARQAVERSADRYVRALNGELISDWTDINNQG